MLVVVFLLDLLVQDCKNVYQKYRMILLDIELLLNQVDILVHLVVILFLEFLQEDTNKANFVIMWMSHFTIHSIAI